MDKKHLAAALISTQMAMDGLHVDGENPHFKSKYATLAAVNETCLRPLAENGIAVFQSARTEDTERGLRVVVRTEFYHAESGESFAEELALRPVKDTPQDIGSAITYGRRYLLMTMAGLAPEDDDGNAASGRDAQPQKAAKRETAQSQQPRQRPAGSAPVLTTDIVREQSTGLGNGHQPAQEPAQQPAANGVWSAMGDYTAARQWATDSGKFGHARHVDAAWSKLFSQHEAHKPENAAKFLAAWREYVENHEPAPPRVGGDSAGVNSEKAATNGQPERIAA